MSQFKIITTKADLPISDNWVDKPYSECIYRHVDSHGHLVSEGYQGKVYSIQSEKVRYFGVIERTSRVALGIIVVICTLGLAAISKSVRNLFTKDHEKIRFGVLTEFPEQHAQGPITADMVSSIEISSVCRETYPCQHDGGDIYFKNGRKMKTEGLNLFEIQALLRSFPDKIKILGNHDFSYREGDPILKGEKVLKYLRVYP